MGVTVLQVTVHFSPVLPVVMFPWIRQIHQTIQTHPMRFVDITIAILLLLGHLAVCKKIALYVSGLKESFKPLTIILGCRESFQSTTLDSIEIPIVLHRSLHQICRACF